MGWWKKLQIGLGAGVLLAATCAAVALLADPASRLYGFLFERSFVQPTTLYVALLVGLLLVGRWRKHRRDRRLFDSARQGQACLPEALARQFAEVNDASEQHGETAAEECAQRVHESYKKRLRKAYEGVNFLAGSLPALGLFGTMLGLSNSLFAAFSGGSLGPEAVQAFVGALATAMDTTVLAMGCAVPLFAVAWLLGRWEQELGEEYDQYLRRQLGLDQIRDKDPVASVLRGELREMTAKIAEVAQENFAKALGQAVETYRETLHVAVKDVFATQRSHDSKVAKRIAEELAQSLNQSVDKVGSLISEHNHRVAQGMIAEVGQLGKALRCRTPEEVVIRYHHNGYAKAGVAR